MASSRAAAPAAAPPAPITIPASPTATGPNPLLKREQERQAAAAAAAKAAAMARKVTAQEVEAAGLSSRDAATGLDLPSPLQLFMQYDVDGSRGVKPDEFKQVRRGTHNTATSLGHRCGRYLPWHHHHVCKQYMRQATLPLLVLTLLALMPAARHGRPWLPTWLQSDAVLLACLLCCLQMLYDLDGLQSVPRKEADVYVMHEFEEADLNHDGVISIDEFFYYFYKELCFKFPVLRTGVNPGAGWGHAHMFGWGDGGWDDCRRFDVRLLISVCPRSQPRRSARNATRHVYCMRVRHIVRHVTARHLPRDLWTVCSTPARA